MDQNWREKKLYPIMGITLTIFLILFLNTDTTTKLSTFPFLLSLPKMGFVGINNTTQFIIINDNDDDDDHVGSSSGGGGEVKGQVLYINGWNSYWLMEESVWSESRWRVSRMLKKGYELGLSVCRTWAFSDGDGPNALQISPGVFNGRVFQGLDYVVVEARRNRIRLILSLVNNLDAFGGKAQYIRWAQEAGANISNTADSFFSDRLIKQYYKAYVRAIVTRKNSITGTHYYDEPAIFAWELINEPRCFNSCAPVLQAWITEMAAYIKSLDHKHLVTVGTEGFYGLERKEKLGVNPGEWAALLGTDFLQNSAIDNIDFASVHAYPDSWIANATLEEKVDYLSHWVDSHINDGDNILKKPVLFSEIGSSLHWTKKGSYEREIFFKTIYEKIYESAKKRQSGAGALIWQLLVEDMESYSDQFSIVAWHHPSIYDLISEQSCQLRNAFAKDASSRSSGKEDVCMDHGP